MKYTWVKRIGILAIWLTTLLFAVPDNVLGQEPRIKVEIRTLKILGGVRNEAMSGVDVTVGGQAVKTDARGRGTLMVEPGTAVSSITAPCPVHFISVTGSVSRTGGSDQAPIFDFPMPSTQTPTITFQMRCDGDTTPGKTRVKIATTTSCKDDPNGGMAVQAGVTVMIGDKEYTSNENGVIDIDLPPGNYPVLGRWKDYALGYVTQNGLRVPVPESGLPTVAITGQHQTLEVRMFTCDATGLPKARAVITEIGNQIWVKRSNASGRAFVGMYLRDGDFVEVTGAAALKWLKPEGTVTFEISTRFYIRPDERPAGQAKPKGMSTFEILQGVGSFLMPVNPQDDDATYDEDGNRIRFKASTHSIAVGIKGTTFSLSHDEATQKSVVTVAEGVVKVTPKYSGMQKFDLTAGQTAEVSPPGGGDRPLIRPTKSVFGVDERIAIDYFNTAASGWDYVVVVQPSRLQLGVDPFSAVTKDHGLQLNPADNSLKERSGTTNFPKLPEGEYEARYIAWAVDGRTGVNQVIAQVPFRVGNAPSPPQPTPSPGTTGNQPPTTRWNLTGLWRNPGGAGIYRLRQVGVKVVWGIDAVAMNSYANVFQGQIFDDNIDGVWEDLPGSPTIGGGRMLLKIESECRFVRVSSVNPYGADVWVKKDSTCDIVGLVQKSTPAAPRREQPKVEEIPEDAIPSRPTPIATNRPQPEVEEIPEDAIPTTATNRPVPEVEEIPEDEITVTQNDLPPPQAESQQPVRQQPQPKPQKTPKPPKPKKEGPGFWEKLGTAINTAVNSMPQQPQPQPPPTGGCSGGSYWLGTPTPDSWRAGTPGDGVRVPWSTPIGVYKASLRIFSGGRDVTGALALPENANACGLSWPLYMPAGYYDVYLYDPSGQHVAGPVRFTVYQ